MINIKNFIKKELKLNKNGNDFIERLYKGSNDEKKLLACIGIDVKHNLLKKKELESLINTVNLKKKSVSLLSIYDTHTDSGSYTISLIKSIKKEKSARVIRLSTFSEYFYNPNVEVDLKEAINENDFIDEIKRGNLERFEMQNGGNKKHKLVWCTPLNDLINILENSDSPANEIVSRLGLGLPLDPDGNIIDNTNYIYFEYPDNFNETTYQPTHLCTYWKEESNLFLSFKYSDDYGRTRSNKGDSQETRLKELVHFSIGKKYSYNIKYLGKFNDLILKKVSYKEAINRYYE